jgi:hypothetical protein
VRVPKVVRPRRLLLVVRPRRLLLVVMALVAAAGSMVVIAPAAQADDLRTSYWKMNSKETSWCRWPSRAKLCGQVYLDEARWSMRHAAACGEDICANGDEQNALQHCLWSSVMKVQHGEGTAREFLTRHEAKSNGDLDSQRDWKNNDLGFRVAEEAAVDFYMDPSDRRGPLLGRCVDLARADQLVYDR